MHPAETALREWGKEPRLTKATGTQLHKMRESIRPDHFVPAGSTSLDQQRHLERFLGTIIWDRVEGKTLQIFVVEHDWAAAFASAGEEVSGLDYRLPYDFCLFEFQISGRRLGVVAFQRHEDKYELHGIVTVPEASAWTALNLNSPYQTAVNALVQRQVRAVCIALEAEVAEAEVIRAPPALNRSRERRGRTSIPDYHVVRLTRRSRVAPSLQRTR